MKTKVAEYEALVQASTSSLQEHTDQVIAHGSTGACPNCGHLGVFDMIGFGLSAGSIYFSAAADKWRCMVCELDSIGY